MAELVVVAMKRVMIAELLAMRAHHQDKRLPTYNFFYWVIVLYAVPLDTAKLIEEYYDMQRSDKTESILNDEINRKIHALSIEESVSLKAGLYELLISQLTHAAKQQINNMGIEILERTGGIVLEGTYYHTFLVYLTQDQIKSAFDLEFVHNLRPYVALYPRQEILDILEHKHESLTIECFCIATSMEKEPLKELAKSLGAVSKNCSNYLKNLGVFKINISQPADIKKIDELAKMDGVHSVEYSSGTSIFKY